MVRNLTTALHYSVFERFVLSLYKKTLTHTMPILIDVMIDSARDHESHKELDFDILDENIYPTKS